MSVFKSGADQGIEVERNRVGSRPTGVSVPISEDSQRQVAPILKLKDAAEERGLRRDCSRVWRF